MKTLFPYKLYLNILQLEGYDTVRFLRWIFRNFFVRDLSAKKTLVHTFKVKIIFLISICVILFSSLYLLLNYQSVFLTTFIFLVLTTQFYIPLAISRSLLIPFEIIYTQFVVLKTKKKIASLSKLKVIAITGSYGKTTVKELLYQIIKDKYKTLRTPESYNTILGISKVVDLELDGSYDFFICEMAAYHNGDIQKLCNMIPPTYGILTGITSQHLERFGSLKNITKTKFELYDSLNDKGDIIFNLHDNNITQAILRLSINEPKGYLEPVNIMFTKSGTNFQINHRGQSYNLQTNLFGRANIINLSGAITMALQLGININDIANKIKHLTPIASRFVTKKYHKATIVDNTFSSNEESFKEMLETARSVHGTKVLITPGLVELGKYEGDINANIGSLSVGIFDKIILVGDNNRTRSIAQTIVQEPEFIPDSREDYFRKIEDLSNEFDWIFLENDVTENY